MHYALRIFNGQPSAIVNSETTDPSPLWHILNYVPVSLAKSRYSAEDWVEKYNTSENKDLKIFSPTFVTFVERKGRREKVRRPLTFHYVFVKGTQPEIKDFCSRGFGFSFVINKGGAQRYATVSDREMQDFRLIASRYSNDLPFFSLEDISLEEGDKVEVVEGDFAGLIGTYFPKNRSNSGNIVLQVTQNLGTVAYDIKARFVRILEFAKTGRRAYDLIDAILPHLYDALRNFSADRPLADKEASELNLFCRRMEKAKLDNNKIDAKLQAILTAANRVLGREEKAALSLEKFRKRETSLTSPASKALAGLLLGASGKDKNLLTEGRKQLDSITDKDSKALSRLREEYEFHIP